MGDRLRAGILSRYVTSQLGQLSLASLRGRLIEYQLRLGEGGNVTSAGWQVTLCDPMWHVSSRSGVATLRTAIHLLLTYNRGSVLLRQRCDMFCTSGFLDNVMLSHNGLYRDMSIPLQRRRKTRKHNRARNRNKLSFKIQNKK